MEFLYQRGLTPIEHAAPAEPLEIYREREYVCSVMPDCKVRFKQRSEDQAAVQKFIDDNYENYILCERLPRMPFESISEYAKFFEVKDAVLAATVMPDDTIEYVTWLYTFNRDGVVWGNRFYNYDDAKQDFAVRAGLIDKQRLFSNEQFTAIHDACVFCVMNDEDLTFKGELELYSLIQTFEQLYPPLAQQPESETENEDENELSQEVDL